MNTPTLEPMPCVVQSQQDSRKLAERTDVGLMGGRGRREDGERRREIAHGDDVSQTEA